MDSKKTSPSSIIPFVWLYTLMGIFSWIFLPVYWPAVLGFFLFFSFGNGTVAHRYFAHTSFKVSRPVHWVLALWATLTGYTPIQYWIVQHRHHHRFTDTVEDLHSPKNGILRSFIFWTVDKKRLASVFSSRTSIANYIQCMRDPAIRFFDRYFLHTNILLLVLLTLIDYHLLFSITLAYVFEQIRLGIINSALHVIKFPLNYRNHKDVADSSSNNYLIGLLTFGFGWHNNHHSNPGKLILTEKWWEIDLEGYLGWLLSLTCRSKDGSKTRR